MKNDLNHIARLEQAISQKYGDITVQNPKKSWTEQKENEYKQQLLELQEKESILENRKLFNRDNNRICFVCNEFSFRSQDDIYMVKFEVCYKCYIKHIEGRENFWEQKKKQIMGEIK